MKYYKNKTQHNRQKYMSENDKEKLTDDTEVLKLGI